MAPGLLAAAAMILLVLGVLFVRIPVALLLALLGFGGYALLDDLPRAVSMVGNELWGTFSSYGLTVIPLFILMGQICFHSGMSERLYAAVHAWSGHRRGGIAVATLLACGGFSAICGSNTATAATMSAVALPEMRKYGYHPVLASGTVAAGTTLGAVIPPSVVAIVVGVQTASSIERLFLGGIVPGLILLLLFLLTLALIARRHPAWAPAGGRLPLAEKLRATPGLLETGLLFFLVIFGLSKGLFTPTEAGAAGAGLALLIGLARRSLNLRGFVKALDESLRISAMIFLLMAGAAMFGKFLTLTRVPFTLADWIAGLDVPPLLVLLLVALIYLVGGMIMDALALLVVTIPIFFPLAETLGWDTLWFSLFLITITTMGAITPPVGVSAYVVSSMSGRDGGSRIPLAQVFRGASYFLPAFVVCLLLMSVFPELAVWLPDLIQPLKG